MKEKVVGEDTKTHFTLERVLLSRTETHARALQLRQTRTGVYIGGA